MEAAHMDRDVNVERLRSELDELQKSRNDIDRLIERKKLLILKALPGVHGFDSMDALIAALAQFASSGLRERIGGAQPASARRGKPRSHPAELRVAVRQALEAGESASKIAGAKGISLATISKWKKLWGLGSKRGRLRRNGAGPSAEAPAAEATVSAEQANGSHEEWAL
jgi:transposase-like protein